MVYYWSPQQGQAQTPVPVAREESYIENILRLNRGKIGSFYFSFDNVGADGQKTRTVRGYVEAAGRDHVILREAQSDHRFLFPMIYFDYAEFDEELNYFNQTPRQAQNVTW